MLACNWLSLRRNALEMNYTGSVMTAAEKKKLQPSSSGVWVLTSPRGFQRETERPSVEPAVAAQSWISKNVQFTAAVVWLTRLTELQLCGQMNIYRFVCVGVLFCCSPFCHRGVSWILSTFTAALSPAAWPGPARPGPARLGSNLSSGRYYLTQMHSG